MNRSSILLNWFTAATFAMMSFSPAASAGTIFLDNAIAISQYAATNGPGTVGPYATSQTGIQNLAVTGYDTTVSSVSNVVLAAYDGSGLSGNGIYAYSPTGVLLSPRFSSVSDPIGLAVGATGNVYVGANGGTTIEELSPTGTFIKNIAASTGVQDQSLAVDAAGDVFAADNNTGNIIEYFAAGGSATYSSAPLDGADNYGMTFDSAGDLFVTYVSFCGGNLCGGIDEFTPGGTLNTFYTTDNPPGGVADDVLPVGVAYDPQSDNLYMSYLNSSNGPSGGIEVFQGESSTPTTFATVSTGFPGAIADETPEPGSILLLSGGLGLTLMLHFRRVRRQKLLRQQG